MAHPPGQEPRTPIPAISDADRAAAFPSLPAHHMHPGRDEFLVSRRPAEWQDADGAARWPGTFPVGSVATSTAWRSARRASVPMATPRKRNCSCCGATPSVPGGNRRRRAPGLQTWLAADSAAFGVQGMPLFGLETEATAFIGEGGQSALRLEAEYDIPLTQRCAAAHRRAQPARAQRRGARRRRRVQRRQSRAAPALRDQPPVCALYRRDWNCAYGNTADLLRAEGEDVSDTRLVAGIRFWF